MLNKDYSLQNYVPRHIRLGVCASAPEVQCFQEFPEEIPIVDSDGIVLEVRKSIKRVPASEAMAKFPCENFRLSKLIKSGVPMSMVNVNRSTNFTIEQLDNINRNIDSAEKFVQNMVAQRNERASWFEEFEASSSGSDSSNQSNS